MCSCTSFRLCLISPKPVQNLSPASSASSRALSLSSYKLCVSEATVFTLLILSFMSNDVLESGLALTTAVTKGLTSSTNSFSGSNSLCRPLKVRVQKSLFKFVHSQSCLGTRTPPRSKLVPLLSPLKLRTTETCSLSKINKNYFDF